MNGTFKFLKILLNKTKSTFSPQGMHQQIVHWGSPSLLRTSCASPCTPPFCRGPTAITGHCQGSPGPSATKPHTTGSWTWCNAGQHLLGNRKKQNWNSIRRTCSRKFLSDKQGKVEKKHLALRQRLSLYTGEETPSSSMLLWDPGQPAIRAGKANTQKTLLP